MAETDNGKQRMFSLTTVLPVMILIIGTIMGFWGGYCVLENKVKAVEHTNCNMATTLQQIISARQENTLKTTRNEMLILALQNQIGNMGKDIEDIKRDVKELIKRQ